MTMLTMMLKMFKFLTTVGYTEDSDAEPVFYWNEDLKNGTGNDSSNEKMDNDVDTEDG